MPRPASAARRISLGDGVHGLVHGRLGDGHYAVGRGRPQPGSDDDLSGLDVPVGDGVGSRCRTGERRERTPATPTRRASSCRSRAVRFDLLLPSDAANGGGVGAVVLIMLHSPWLQSALGRSRCRWSHPPTATALSDFPLVRAIGPRYRRASRRYRTPVRKSCLRDLRPRRRFGRCSCARSQRATRPWSSRCSRVALVASGAPQALERPPAIAEAALEACSARKRKGRPRRWRASSKTSCAASSGRACRCPFGANDVERRRSSSSSCCAWSARSRP